MVLRCGEIGHITWITWIVLIIMWKCCETHQMPIDPATARRFVTRATALRWRVIPSEQCPYTKKSKIQTKQKKKEKRKQENALNTC